MKIRKATKKDLKSLNELQLALADYECFLCKTLKKPESVKKKYFNNYKKKIKSKNCIFFVAEDKGKIIGYVLGEIETPEHPHIFNKRGYIVDAFILKEYRRMGMGEQLFQELIKWFKSKGVKWIKVGVYANNFNSIKFWGKMGFKEYVIWMTKIIQ